MCAPFVWIYVCFAAGIFVGKDWTISGWILAGGVACAGAGLLSEKFHVGMIAQALMFFLLGQQFYAVQLREYDSPLRLWVQAHESEAVSLRGVVLRTPEIAEDYFTLRVRVLSVAQQNLSGVLRLTVSGSARQFPVAGDVIETFGRLRLPANFRAEGSFDYKKYLMKEGIQALGSVKSASLLRITGREPSAIFWFSRLRLQMINRIRTEFAPQDAAILRALWLDDRSALSHETEQILIDAGIFHVIAISGFHIAVVIFLLFLLLKWLVRYRVALLILAAFLLLYFLLLEGRSSITRSFLMFLILAVSVWRYETPNWSNTLSLSAFIQLLLNPLEIFDPGYQLTYLSTAAILFIAAPVIRRVRLPRKGYQMLFDFLITTTAIQFLLAPYQAYTFHRIPLVSMLANWAAIPVSSFLIALGLFLLPFPFLYRLFAPFLHWILQSFMSPAEFFSGLWPGVISQPHIAVVVLFYLSIVVILANRKRILRIAGILGCSIAILLIFNSGSPKPKSFFRIHFIDVGQGDAILLEYPDGTFDLVDGGGSWNREALDIGESVLIPYLSHWGVDKIHRIFLTHAHADHMNGLFSVLRYIPVEEFYVARRPLADPGYQALMHCLPAFPTPIQAGARFQQGGVQMEVLGPEDSSKILGVGNNDSMLLLLRYEGKQILLAGDAEKGSEDKLLQIDGLGADYLKVPHHGSRSSSSLELLNQLKMKVVFISVGRQNWFGHPHPEVVARYRDFHALVYRTDQIGTIRLTLNGGEGKVDSYAWSHD